MHKLDIYIENQESAIESTVKTNFFALVYEEEGAMKVKVQGSPPGFNLTALLPMILNAVMKKQP